MNTNILILALALVPNISHAQSNNPTADVNGGRWVPAGTFAYSDLPEIEKRDRSYSKASKDNDRISTYLPGMTLVFDIRKSNDRSGYVKGITHSGIPIKVPREYLSTGKFENKSFRDVVIHRDHLACRRSTCRPGEVIKIGAGLTFSIVLENSDYIEIVNSNELRAFYPRENFKSNERNGYLTQHKDRQNPRWSIHDGYASELSTACGEKISRSGFKIDVSSQDYLSDPASWSVDDIRWSLKAIEIFNLGEVKLDPNTGVYTGILVKDIEDQQADEGDLTTIDFTVFSYRDTTWRQDYYKFAGILQIVQCDNNAPVGEITPTFAKEAYLYFDNDDPGDNSEQSFPLGPAVELPRQLAEKDQSSIYQYVKRSFYYSINSVEDYEEVFDAISEILAYPTAVANVIARLNASCSESRRDTCSEFSKGMIEADQ